MSSCSTFRPTQGGCQLLLLPLSPQPLTRGAQAEGHKQGQSGPADAKPGTWFGIRARLLPSDPAMTVRRKGRRPTTQRTGQGGATRKRVRGQSEMHSFSSIPASPCPHPASSHTLRCTCTAGQHLAECTPRAPAAPSPAEEGRTESALAQVSLCLDSVQVPCESCPRRSKHLGENFISHPQTKAAPLWCGFREGPGWPRGRGHGWRWTAFPAPHRSSSWPDQRRPQVQRAPPNPRLGTLHPIFVAS